jgi:RNA polymerase sigma-70 factor (ECF subfamily)
MLRETATIEQASGLKNPALFAVSPRENQTSALITDETKFETFYGEHARPLWAYVRRMANDPALADDIVQESFLRFLGAPAAALSRSSDFNEKAYLYRIATNLTYDYFRRSARDAKRQTELDCKDRAYEPFAASGDAMQILEKMKMQERALLYLAYVEGQSHQEIAGTLGLKTLSVRVLLFRARRKLANLLDAE